MASAVLLALNRLALSPVERLVENTGLRTVAIELSANLTARQIIDRAAESGARTLFLHADLPLANGSGGMRSGLRILEDLVLEEAYPGSIVITSFEPSEQLRRSLTPSIMDGRPAILPRRAVGIEFLQLPGTESAWRRALGRATRSRRPERVKRNLEQARQRLILAQKAAEDGAFRHRVKNYRAAVRLLQGAMYGGCVSSETYLELLRTIAARRPRSGALQELAEIGDEAQRAAARYPGLYPLEVPLHSERWQQALLIDDQAESAGWELVLRHAREKAPSRDPLLHEHRRGSPGGCRAKQPGRRPARLSLRRGACKPRHRRPLAGTPAWGPDHHVHGTQRRAYRHSAAGTGSLAVFRKGAGRG